ncbi:MAG: radical SAM protein [Sulfolobales archaeon]|nr:radical SAM protein [Sulfolobales archaeon]MCX8198644.1 radical SAM protein [Sulfolobales archaeon]MDW8169718.1 radical SAM protein [Desulfurococcaceae archaeon]
MNAPRKLYYSLRTGYVIGSLPPGCRYCILGGKIVIFITGLCLDNCWYCPISREKFGRKTIYVDEVRAASYSDVIDEAYRVGALGAGITGGDPIIPLDVTINMIRLLKDEFGEGFHIHLYTTGRLIDDNVLEVLESSGLDELRIHPYKAEYIRVIERAIEYSFDVVVEVPFIPLRSYVNYIKDLLMKLDGVGVNYVNINEFEVSDSNVEATLLRGLKPLGFTLEGIETPAIEFVKWVLETVKNLNVHYCTVEFKDRVQYRLRMVRKALTVFGLHEAPTINGTLISVETFNEVQDHTIRFNDRNYLIMGKPLLKSRSIKGVLREYYPGGESEALYERDVLY